MAVYVLSDIHGAYNKFKKMLKKINFTDNDIMYVLGDVIDRGKEPIPLLLDIMNRKNIVLLLGNHEQMMYRVYTYNSYSDNKLWFNNGGGITDTQFKTMLSDTQKTEVLNYLKECPVSVPLMVNEKLYWLSHASFAYKPEIYKNKHIVKRYDLGPYMENVIWGRDYPFYAMTQLEIYPYIKDATLITGHTPTWEYVADRSGMNINKVTESKCGIFRGNSGHFIGVDCGCAAFAYGHSKGRLGCLRLDDMKEFYV